LRVKQVLPHLPKIRNTTVGTLLGWLLTDLYGYKGSRKSTTWSTGRTAARKAIAGTAFGRRQVAFYLCRDRERLRGLFHGQRWPSF
jgi:hypothetical protein